MAATAAVAGAAGAGIPVLTSARDRDGQDAAIAKHQWVMVIDLRRCDGCEECTFACNEMHGLPEDQPWIPVFELENEGGQKYFLPRPCMQCENPPCTRVCPVGATYTAPDGVTLVDQNVCIGCRTCLAACPYDARTFTWDDPPKVESLTGPSPEYPVPQQRNTAGKCVFCVHDLRVGKLPACVRACSMEALYIGDLKTDLVTNGVETRRLSDFLKENDAVRLREELGTQPRVYYILGHAQDLDY